MRQLVDANNTLWESRNGTSAYTNLAFPNTAANTKELLINYYDDYKFKTATVLPATTGIDSTWMVKGLLTGAKVTKDDGTSPLLSVNYYDKYGQAIESVSDNHLGGVDRITNTYNFSGQLITAKHQHRINGSATVTTILTTNDYDHVGRLIQTNKKVNSQAEVIQSQLVYNEIGQLKQKKLHADKTTPTNVIATVNYEYNERSWPTKISSEKFTEMLKYAESEVTNKQYNGDIAEQHWAHDNTILSNTFKYTYDPLGKLKNGTSAQMSEDMGYDIMGNIVRLARDTDPVMKYSYIGNRLTEIKRESDNVSLGTYIYNENGSATKDRLGMTVRYNHLNLPDSVYNATTKVGYLYDATGKKLRKYSTVGTSYSERDYIKGFEYLKIHSSGTKGIDLIATEEGYLKSNGSNPYTYFYNLTDHLGNVRSTITTLTTTSAQVVQKDDYYPFGKRKSAGLTNGINKYLYNSKEIQEEIGSQYDYGARFYDAEIGRWNIIDPLADAAYNWSPYRYGYNNPIKFTDPTGMLEDWVSLDGNVFYDSRVVDQASAQEFYGERAKYRAIGFKYTSTSGNRIELGDHGFYMLNGETFNSPDRGESAIMSAPVDHSGKIMNAGLVLSAGLLADNVTGIGVADDVVIPGVLLAAGAGSILGKMSFELDKIRAKKNAGPQGWQYALTAVTSGDYPIFTRGFKNKTGEMHLNKGDVWKYGETTSSDRYDPAYLRSIGPGGVTFERQIPGNQKQIKVYEKVKIYHYFLTNGHLPPGNKIFR
jgi:RHS repeat-associated protein